MITIVSFYTPEYKVEAEKLISSMKTFDISYVVYPIPSEGTWQKNTHMKPKILEQAFKEIDNDILYVDADATFHAKPNIFPIKCDFAAHLMAKKHWHQSIKIRQFSLMSGTVYFPNTAKALEVIIVWKEICKARPNTWDQRCLEKLQNEFDFVNLPVEYCYIDRTMWGINNPVICHHQASRRIKV